MPRQTCVGSHEGVEASTTLQLGGAPRLLPNPVDPPLHAALTGLHIDPSNHALQSALNDALSAKNRGAARGPQLFGPDTMARLAMDPRGRPLLEDAEFMGRLKMVTAHPEMLNSMLGDSKMQLVGCKEMGSSCAVQASLIMSAGTPHSIQLGLPSTIGLSFRPDPASPATLLPGTPTSLPRPWRSCWALRWPVARRRRLQRCGAAAARLSMRHPAQAAAATQAQEQVPAARQRRARCVQGQVGPSPLF
jgi:hypothetical protein